MNKKSFCIIIIVALAIISGWSYNQNKNTNINLISTDIESMAACESIGWWNSNGNCVKNDANVYFCKSDSWPALTDCKQ